MPQARGIEPAALPRRGAGQRLALRVTALALALGALAPPGAGAITRLVKRYDERDGLAVTEIVELAQDARGFLWVGTVGGVVRFDGAEMRSWAPESLQHVVRFFACSPLGDVVEGALDEPLWRMTVDGVEALRGPHGERVTRWVHASYAHDGALWIACADTLWRRDSRGEWLSWSARAFGGEAFLRVHPDDGARVFVCTEENAWSFSPGGAPRVIARLHAVHYAARCSNGDVALLTGAGVLHRVHAGRDSVLFAGNSHGRGLAVRGDDVWASIDQYVIAAPPDHPAEIVAPQPGMPTGRPLLVDREGTLWMGSYQGLIAMPEPATLIRDERDGLPSPPHEHDLARTKDAVIALSWYGAVRVPTNRMRPRAEPLGLWAGGFGIDARGRPWCARDGEFARWEGATAHRYPCAGLHGIYAGCVRRDGTTWLATDDGLFLAPQGEGAPRFVRVPPPPGLANGWTDANLGPVLEDRHGRLWFTIGEDVWSADADSVAREQRVAWRREPIPTSDGGTALLEMADGEIWLGTANAGVLRHDGNGWTPLPGNRDLASLRVYAMRPSPRGGAWVLAVGSLVRALPDPRSPAGWRIAERLRAWQGVPTQQAGDVAEDVDGTLWLATLSGLVEVSPQARVAMPVPPHVELVDLLVDGRRLPLDRIVRLTSRRNRVELRFAALSYRDRSQLRYQVRLRPSDPWQDSGEPSFRFVDLQPGEYAAQVRASLDGERWTWPPTRVEFSVDRPWFATWWAIALFALALGGILLAAHRIRVGVLLRLERQRTRIAMDLHDEMGSGLGSIGILAGLAADESLDEPTRRSLARRIAATTSELGGALSDIVRSLRRGEDTLESFGLGLIERGRRLMPGEQPAFVARMPDGWPNVRMAPETQRELTLIAAEALHNAARHAGARQVELVLEPGGDGWRLRIADDGCGMGAAPASNGHGNGLRNMRARAESLGARIAWTARPGGGTVVELHFDPTRRPSERVAS
jgi:signal transduction histidine kinase/ligand-binding sensor domain-containing protein